MTLATSQAASERSMLIFLLLKIAQKSKKNKKPSLKSSPKLIKNNWGQPVTRKRVDTVLKVNPKWHNRPDKPHVF